MESYEGRFSGLQLLSTETDNTALYTIKSSIMNMQNRLVHHLIGTKLCCALLKCMSVQNYIVNLDMHVRCQPPKYSYYLSLNYFAAFPIK